MSSIVTIVFGPADRERYGLPDACTYDFSRLSLRDAVAIQLHGYADVDAWLVAIRAEPMDYAALGLLYWLAARHAGCTVSYQDFDPDLLAVRQQDGDDQGKDLSTPPGTSDASVTDTP